MMPQKQGSLFDRVVHEAGHAVFRFVSLGFSAISAHAIYWFFSALNGVDWLQVYFTWLIAISFTVLGYFVTRGLALRIMHKKRVRAYLFVGVPYVFVEVVCNFGEAAARYPDMQWIHHLQGWQFTVFSFLAPVMLSIIPLFNLSLANIDVDLMAEKLTPVGGVPGYAPTAKPPQMWTGGQPTVNLPQATYPQMPAPGQGKGNALADWWNKQKLVKQAVIQGAQPKP